VAEELYERIVDAMNALHGAHPGFRAAHAKGVFCGGSFTASAKAGELSRAAHLLGGPVRVTARFSNGSGNPEAEDADRRDGRGLAVKFHLADGEITDIVSVSIPVFFVNTPEDFLDFVRARAPDPETGEMDMEKVGAFLAEHPETQAAVGQVLPALTPPRSFATSAYNGLHAFGLVDAGGERRWARYSWRPEAGEATLSEQEIKAADRDYLQEEIRERLGREPVRFTLTAKLADDGDPLDDVTRTWPDDREIVELGTLELTEPIEGAEDEGVIVFDPVNLTDGIELPRDPIVQARSAAYSVSVERRSAVRS
jgi:catalase